MYRTLAILLLFLSSVYPTGSKEQDGQWQQEIASTSYQNDYTAAFIIKRNSLIVDAKGCQPFDTRCVWQYVRVWIGIAIDELNAQKETAENTASSTGLRCTLTYSVYQKNPEKVFLQCQEDSTAKTIHYTRLEQFLKQKFP